MTFDPDNNIIQLCGQGMEMESRDQDEAKRLFLQAWHEASNDFEKFIAAHYVARHQKSIQEKLAWDETALTCALKIPGEQAAASYPSLYLNIAKCHEDLGDLTRAKKHYDLALSYEGALADDGYGRMIRTGIKSGIERVSVS